MPPALLQRSIRLFLLGAATFTFSVSALAQTRSALLIGINTYSPQDSKGTSQNPLRNGQTGHAPDSRFGETIAWPNLQGPENDAATMAALLPQFGFSDIHQLKGAEATRAAVLAAIDKYVVNGPHSGDTVLFYFAGHGSQRFNSRSSKIDHLDETIVPADAYLGAFDVRDKELARKFNLAIDKGVRIIAIFDSCHSGTMARGAKVGVARWLPYDDRDAADGGDYGNGQIPQPRSPAQRGAIVISAALSTQSAEEIADDHGTVHGVFTSAFIRALRNSTSAWTASDLVNSTDALLKADGWTQEPTIEGPANRPLFGDFSIAGIHATVQAVEAPDKVTLNVGSALGLGTGSEFARANPATSLRATEIDGPASSTAKISSGEIRTVHSGDVFQIASLAVPDESKLTIFVPGVASDTEWGKLKEQVDTLRGGKNWSLVRDALEQLPTNLVYWTTAGWVSTVARGGTVSLGESLTSDAIAKTVRDGARVFVSMPPPQALIDALAHQSGISKGVIQISSSLAQSQYVLVGRSTHGAGTSAQFALLLPGVFGGFNPANLVRNRMDGRTVVCSTDSDMPLGTDWVATTFQAADLTSAANDLQSASLKLGRDRSWLRTEANNGDGYWPYRLVVTRPQHGQPLSSGLLSAGTEYEIRLVADPQQLSNQVVQPQYVYLFGLQCDGAGQLLYPSANLGGGAPLPLLSEDGGDQTYPSNIKIATLRVAPPLGFDTIVMLATQQRISDLGAFNYSGVVNEGTSRGTSNQLEELVRSISGQSRGVGVISATWSMQRVSVKSR